MSKTIVLNVEDVRRKIKQKEKELASLKSQITNQPLKLSVVYRDGLAYGIAYKTGYGNEIEIYNEVDNLPERLEETAKQHFEVGWEGDPAYPIYIVGLRPEKVVKIITKGD